MGAGWQSTRVTKPDSKIKVSEVQVAPEAVFRKTKYPFVRWQSCRSQTFMAI